MGFIKRYPTLPVSAGTREKNGKGQLPTTMARVLIQILKGFKPKEPWGGGDKNRSQDLLREDHLQVQCLETAKSPVSLVTPVINKSLLAQIHDGKNYIYIYIWGQRKEL